MHTSYLEIDLDRVAGNLAAFRAIVARDAADGDETRAARVCGVVKADAYGLGAAPIARRLAAEGVDMLAVFSPQQAEDIAGVIGETPILVLMRTDELDNGSPLGDLARADRLHLTVHATSQLSALARLGRSLGRRLPVHVYLDTGMNRGGVAVADLPLMLSHLSRSRFLRLAGILTHMACGESDPNFCEHQFDTLDAFLHTHEPHLPDDLLVHVANTCTTLQHPRYHRDMVRIGLGLYGYGPEQFPADRLPAGAAALRPVARWLSRIIHVRDARAGEPVGYGGTHHLQRDSRLGLIPVGFADGYPLALSNRGAVEVLNPNDDRPHAAPVLGRVNMDQIVVDLTDLPSIGVGVEAALISDRPDSPAALPRLAELAGCHCYELLCRLSPRLERRYVDRDRDERGRRDRPSVSAAGSAVAGHR